MRRVIGLAACFAIAFAGLVAIGATITVGPGGDHATIQAAINAAVVGDTIEVAAGTYAENVTVNKSVSILGAPGVVLQGSGGNGLLIQAPDIVIQGFEIKGYAIGVRTYGGPSNYSTLSLRDLLITGNTVGMQINRDGFTTLTVDRCQIIGNTREGMSIIDHLLGALQINDLVIKDSNVSNNGRHGLMLVRTKIDTLSIEDSSFDGSTGNGYSGISFVSSPSQVGEFSMSGGSLSGNKGCGLSVVQAAHVLGDITLDGVMVSGNRESGITLGGGAVAGSLSILNSAFTANGWEELDISGGWFGSFSVTGETTIQGNAFVRSGGTWVAVYIGNQASFGSVPRMIGNDIIGYGIAHYAGSFLVDFSGNWWGTAAGRTIGGNSAYSPWLANAICAPTWTFIVDDVGNQPPGGYLQTALDQARDGDSVLVKAGEYLTQAVVGVDVQIIGEPGAVVKSPGSQTYTIAESSSVFDPVVFAYGGTIAGTHVSGPAVSFTDVLFLTVDGQSVIPPGGSRLVGVLYRNVFGTIQGNTIQNLLPGGAGSAAETFGILVHGDSVVDIVGNVVSEYSRGGIGVSGDLNGWLRGPEKDPTANIVGNVVTGNGLETSTGWWAENGIQIGYGATGQIIGNTVSGHWVNNPSWTSTGILVVGSDDVDVLDNYVHDNETGIAAMGLTPWGGEPASGNRIVGNTVIDGDYGISLQYDALNTLIERNVLSGNYVAINGFGWGGAEPVGSAIRFNSIAGNTYGVVNYDLPNAVVSGLDAALNWWGSAEGPTVATNPDGDGDTIYGDVIYSPWLGSNPDGDALLPGVQITDPLYIVVAPVGPEPTGGYLNTAIGGSNEITGVGAHTIGVRAGTYDASEPVTNAVSLLNEGGSAAQTVLTGPMSLASGNVRVGRFGQGFTVLGPITVGAGVDASTIHINWNCLFDSVTNEGLNTLDATFNYWGEDGPNTVGDVAIFPLLPVCADTIIEYIQGLGLTPLEAIEYAEMVGLNVDELDALLVVQLMREFGFGRGEAEEIVDEYGWFLVSHALSMAFGEYEEFSTLLLGYALGGPAGGGGGETEVHVVGDTIPFSLELLHPVTGEPITTGAMTASVLHTDENGDTWFVALEIMTYSEEEGRFVCSLDTTGYAPGIYEVVLGSRDLRHHWFQIELVEG